MIPSPLRSRALMAPPLLVLLLGCLLSDSPAPAPPSPESGAVRSVTAYFHTNNTAARHGPDAQRTFLRRTQHPDYRDQRCSLDGMTITAEPALGTLRPDEEFTVAGRHPVGRVWVVGVEITVRRGGVVVGRQLGSQHLVAIDGRWYGFAPCPG
ncbi:hypothetical protein SAMN04487904_104323 [Actinopolyspora lacussalsi subsp. righensis]|uniref:Uncharacterized protein n=2 Tax=Actinopolyspora righensis TaxID=995060 RepID=A0A1I6ZG80_9ACTN|nr:hypothetical protein SAMN04487904_104323 [Actinopolyspora righensis]